MIESILMILFVLLLVQIYFLRKKLSQAVTVFVAMGEGLLFGYLSYRFVPDPALLDLPRKLFSTVGYGYIDLLRMIVIPLVPTSIIVSFLKISDKEKLKKLGFRTIGMFLFTAAAASVIGILVATVMGLGNGVNTAGIEVTREASTLTDMFSQIRGFIPKSPVQSMAELNLVPVIVFSMFIAVAATKEQSRNPEKVAPFKNVLESFLTVIYRVTKYVIRLTPYGVLGLTAYWFSNAAGLDSVAALGLFVLGIVIASVLHVFITYGSIMRFVNKISFIKFLQRAFPAMLLAFTSRSSAGTLTLTLETTKKRLKVSEGVADFVTPLGAVMNMDACGGLYPVIVAVFAANAWNITLSPTDYIVLIFVAILASLGSAGVPMGATVFTTITLTTLGLPLEVIGIVIGVDFLVDMFRTSVNVTGDMVTAVTVGNSIGEFDREAFNRPIDNTDLV